MNNKQLFALLREFYTASRTTVAVYDEMFNNELVLKRPLAPDLSEKERRLIEQIIPSHQIEVFRIGSGRYLCVFHLLATKQTVVLWSNVETLESAGQYSSFTNGADLDQLIAQAKMLYYSLFQTFPRISSAYSDSMPEWSNVEGQITRSENRDLNIVHNDYYKEKFMLKAVSDGNLAEYRHRMRVFVQSGIFGNMATSELRNAKNLLIAAVTIFCRAAIEGGLYYETAFEISDQCCQNIEKMQSVESSTQAIQDIGELFVKRVRSARQYSHNRAIYEIQDYVYKNLNSHIELSVLAKNVGYSKNYVCQIFKDDTGQTINEYINKEKIREAQYQLLFSNSSVTDISRLLGFSDPSYFTKVFIKYARVSPLAYRKMNNVS